MLFIMLFTNCTIKVDRSTLILKFFFYCLIYFMFVWTILCDEDSFILFLLHHSLFMIITIYLSCIFTLWIRFLLS